MVSESMLCTVPLMCVYSMCWM